MFCNSSYWMNIAFSFPDQTPTPTKFLKYGEEIGLFHELTKSPFDEAFRKAITNDVSIVTTSIV